ncbi:MAG: hypothetical protein QM773_14285 [Hyphomonadaceae bacterium]
MKVRRDILLFGALAVVALVGGLLLVLGKPGASVDGFVRDSKARAAKTQIAPVNAEAFRGTVCAATPCVLVEAGGLAFVVGTGEGAADGLSGLGLMRSDLDAIVLPDLTLETVAGLPGLARASLMKGRTQTLKVYGPAGIVPVVDGINLMLSGDPGVRLAVGAETEDQGLEGVVVFDSGVVSIRAFGGQGRGESRVHRIDFEGKSLVLAGCAAKAEQIVAAARGTKLVAGILAASSPELAPENRSVCISVKDALTAAGQAKLAATVLAPLLPSAAIPGSLGAWGEILKREKAPATILGGPGTVLDLSGETPSMRAPS